VSGEYLGEGSRVGTDGFFPTRDGGWIDEEGYLFLEGRADDIIVRGGENMSPGEFEEVLIEHPAVADCAVVGVPDEQWGEAVAPVQAPPPPGTVSRSSFAVGDASLRCFSRLGRSLNPLARGSTPWRPTNEFNELRSACLDTAPRAHPHSVTIKRRVMGYLAG
jgi:AMP-binding enzyme C-terminal domain